MTPSAGGDMAHWQQVDEVFRAALERLPDERAAYLAQACAGDGDLRREVESLLAADAGSDGSLEAAVEAEVASLGEEGAVSWAGRRLGPYRISRELGHGGTLVDIGGQDSKVIGLGPKGSVLDFAMNDKCAAGTGRFLENTASRYTLLSGLSSLIWRAFFTAF